MPGFSFGKPKCAWCLRHEAAQRGELTDDTPQPMMPVPWERAASSSSPTLTYLLVGANVLIYIAMGAAGISLSNPSGQDLFRLGANYGPVMLSGQWWRLITYNFLHSGFLHIGFNMWCLWDLGALAESLYGTWTFGLLYLICGISGGLMSTWWNPVNLTVGASGAIFGLAGALIAGFYLGEFTIPRPMIQMQLRSIVIFVGYNVVLGAFSGLTDNACHFGGIIAGLIVGAAIAKFAPAPQDALRRVVILLLMALVLFGAYRGLQRAHGIGRSVLGKAFQEHRFNRTVSRKPFQEKRLNPSSEFASTTGRFVRSS